MTIFYMDSHRFNSRINITDAAEDTISKCVDIKLILERKNCQNTLPLMLQVCQDLPSKSLNQKLPGKYDLHYRLQITVNALLRH
jgi:hypothetical protein